MNRDYIEVEQTVPGVAGSVWLASNAKEYPTLGGDRTADVVVVGGGITGALVARKLSGGGRHVILLDRRRIASGTTGHSTAKVTALHGDSWRALAGKIDEDEVRSWASANLAAVNELATIAGSLGAECGLRRVPAFLVAGDDAAGAAFDEQLAALVSAGLPATAATAPDPFGRPAAAIAGQALIDPGAFVVAVIAALGSNAEVFESSPVRSLDRLDDGWRAMSDHGSVSAPVAIMADHFPMHDTGGFFTRLFPYALFSLKVGSDAILKSEAYTTKAACMNGIESVKTNAPDEGRYRRTTTPDGKFRFALDAANGQAIGASEYYETADALDEAIEFMKKNAPDAEVKDLT